MTGEADTHIFVILIIFRVMLVLHKQLNTIVNCQFKLTTKQVLMGLTTESRHITEFRDRLTFFKNASEVPSVILRFVGGNLRQVPVVSQLR